jgi:hypothetical protein
VRSCEETRMASQRHAIVMVHNNLINCRVERASPRSQA